MAITPKWQPRRTMVDLYVERDRTQWHWRLLGVLSASMILLGYVAERIPLPQSKLMVVSFLVFPASFQTVTNLQLNQGAISIVAVILLALGYSLSVALWFICNNWLFQFDVLFMYVASQIKESATDNSIPGRVSRLACLALSISA